jgi:hypothetical protein
MPVSKDRRLIYQSLDCLATQRAGPSRIYRKRGARCCHQYLAGRARRVFRSLATPSPYGWSPLRFERDLREHRGYRQVIEQLNARWLDVGFAKRPLGTFKGRLVRREPLVFAAADTFGTCSGCALPLALYRERSVSREAALAALNGNELTWEFLPNKSRDGVVGTRCREPHWFRGSCFPPITRPARLPPHQSPQTGQGPCPPNLGRAPLHLTAWRGNAGSLLKALCDIPQGDCATIPPSEAGLNRRHPKSNGHIGIYRPARSCRFLGLRVRRWGS